MHKKNPMTATKVEKKGLKKKQLTELHPYVFTLNNLTGFDPRYLALNK